MGICHPWQLVAALDEVVRKVLKLAEESSEMVLGSLSQSRVSVPTVRMCRLLKSLLKPQKRISASRCLATRDLSVVAHQHLVRFKEVAGYVKVAEWSQGEPKFGKTRALGCAAGGR